MGHYVNGKKNGVWTTFYPDTIQEIVSQEIYKKRNIGLEDLTDKELEEHYLFIGNYEKLLYKIPEDFDYIFYGDLYSELCNLNKSELINHYLMIGSKEGRYYKIPDDFDSNKYKRIHLDLVHMSDNEAFNHFKEFGMREKRTYK
jgi:hypothetical protein